MINALILSSLAGLSTVLGSLLPFYKIKNREGSLSFFLAFNSGVLISISIFDLLLESFKNLINHYYLINIIEIYIINLIIGIIIYKITTKLSPLPENSLYRVGIVSTICLIMHNLPEGIITFFTTYNDLNDGIKIMIAIAMHNLPEGLMISLPIYYATKSLKRGVKYSLIAALAEPVGGLVTYILLNSYINDLNISFIMIIVSGLMITLSIDNYIESIKYNNIKLSNIGLIIGILLVIIMSIFI